MSDAAHVDEVPAALALTGHTGTVLAVATTVVVDGRVLALTGSGEDFHGELWVRDVIARERVGPELVFPHPVRASAGAPGGRLVLTPAR
ncbi:hypothetical protein ACFP3U_06580 [Kitasatospora misakiensis]|uniref:Uncharacterized protein n=1 Tax=Kitasatospora misakiensis TaxID=67330 RepID=A0ABW0WYL3_9ACTN